MSLLIIGEIKSCSQAALSYGCSVQACSCCSDVCRCVQIALCQPPAQGSLLGCSSGVFPHILGTWVKVPGPLFVREQYLQRDVLCPLLALPLTGEKNLGVDSTEEWLSWSVVPARVHRDCGWCGSGRRPLQRKSSLITQLPLVRNEETLGEIFVSLSLPS